MLRTCPNSKCCPTNINQNSLRLLRAQGLRGNLNAVALHRHHGLFVVLVAIFDGG